MLNKLKQGIHFGMIPEKIMRNQKLSPLAKLIFEEIFTFQIQGKPCYMTNSLFSQFYGKSKKTISRNITELKKANLIIVKVQKYRENNGLLAWGHVLTLTKSIRQKLFVNNLNNDQRVCSNMSTRVKTNTSKRHLNNGKQNHINNNISTNNINNINRHARHREVRNNGGFNRQNDEDDDKLAKEARAIYYVFNTYTQYKHFKSQIKRTALHTKRIEGFLNTIGYNALLELLKRVNVEKVKNLWPYLTACIHNMEYPNQTTKLDQKRNKQQNNSNKDNDETIANGNGDYLTSKRDYEEYDKLFDGK